MKFEYRINPQGCAALTSIPDPESVIHIPDTLGGCPVTEIGSDIIPMGVKSVAREIILPDTVTRIGVRAFNDLRYLKKLTIPESVQTIEDFSIFTCPDLTELYIPESVTTFGDYAFGYMYEHGRAYRLNCSVRRIPPLMILPCKTKSNSASCKSTAIYEQNTAGKMR